jgi:catechol 2,3-dioxygenase-like lactoylglutathione lyase family enzyme
MAISGIDHLYAETSQWEASVAFWEGLGFAFVERWGSEGHRAGRLACGAAAVVLAEITDGDPTFDVFFEVDDLHGIDPAPGVEVVTPPGDTHWGTRWMRVRDPDGRTYALEEEGA